MACFVGHPLLSRRLQATVDSFLQPFHILEEEGELLRGQHLSSHEDVFQLAQLWILLLSLWLWCPSCAQQVAFASLLTWADPIQGYSSTL